MGPPAAGGGHGLVWVNSETHVYHKEGSRFYGTTKKGKYMTEAEAMKEGRLSMWTIYSHPTDFPHSYVARRFDVGEDGALPTPDIIQGELRALRSSFRAAGLHCLTRQRQDEPQIVETWL